MAKRSTKHPGGRPSALGVPRDRVLNIKLSEAELGVVDVLAAKNNLSRSEFVRRAILAIAVHPYLVATPPSPKP